VKDNGDDVSEGTATDADEDAGNVDEPSIFGQCEMLAV